LRRFPLLLVMCALVLASASECSAQRIFHKKKKVDKSTDAANTAEPDKQLYGKAIEDIKHGRHEVGRLGLQTLINTYPDSEYLAKAKLAIADSYFKEGGTANITQAIAGYKDFIVFFPFLPEAPYAQMQVAMANYKEMAKPDRDNTHALDAESELQTFLQKYPKDPLAPQAEQRLREVQEVLAEGQYRVAYFYYVKGDRRAAAGRLIPLAGRYPLYSKSDTAWWMLGDIYEKSEQKDLAGKCYAQIVKNYPLSSRAADAKGKLKAFGMPVPQPDPKAMEWMTAEQNTPRQRESLLHKPLAIFNSGPNVQSAATHGLPNLQPQGEDQAGVDILKGGNKSSLGGGSGVVLTVKPGETTPAGSGSGTATSEDVNTNSSSSDPPADPKESSSSSSTDSQTGSTGAAAADGTAGSTGTDGSTNADGSKADNTTPASANSDQNGKKQKESSSKKKGLKKILPW
jgi:outer membrane protein assembly factor BamD